MWKFKKFKTQSEAQAFIEINKNKYRCELVFVENGYKVEYKKLVRVY